MNYSDIDYIHGIKANNDSILKALYHQYYRMIRHYIISNSGNESDVKDVYHETLLILINTIKREGFVLKSSLSTFIYSIAKRIWLKQINKNKNLFLSEDLYHQNFETIDDDIDNILEEYRQNEENITQMHIALQQLGQPCYNLLKEFYYTQLSMEQIAEKMGYNNADTAKNQKYKCLQRLKKYFFETPSIKQKNSTI